MSIEGACPDQESVGLGAATEMTFPNYMFDAVLMVGSLYHLTKRGDRLKALADGRHRNVTGKDYFRSVLLMYSGCA